MKGLKKGCLAAAAAALLLAGSGAAVRAEELLRDYMARVIRRMGSSEFAALLQGWRRWDTAMREELPVPTGGT